MFRNYDEVIAMDSESIRLAMLELWHDIDYNVLTEEEAKEVDEQLRLYRDVLRERQYQYRRYPDY